MIAIIIFLLILNVLIIVHELGHYILAKRVGVEVKEFAIGLGPAIFQKEWNNTVWKINIFPIGGYNALKGESESEGGKGNFATARKRDKLQVLFAGSLMNFLLAIVAFYIMMPFFNWQVPAMIEFQPVGGKLTTVGKLTEGPIIYEVSDNSSLKNESITFPVELVSVSGEKVSSTEDAIVKITSHAKEGNTSVELELRDLNSQEVKSYTASYFDSNKIGITIADTQDTYAIDYGENLATKAFSGFSHSINIVKVTGTFFYRMVAYVNTTKDFSPVSQTVSGPVGVYAVVDDIVASSGAMLRDLGHLTGLISLNLAIFNLLPFPGLDGWHILIVALEKVRKKKFNENTLGIISLIGLGLLLAFSFLITIKDVFLYIIK
ncbi:MAG: M50 family metallopeptidase [Candidatus Dojkabacteria bacterium]|nr:MAG: M50 family metallopeptidase [Candidatus Dojkabacteria bacterium]